MRSVIFGVDGLTFRILNPLIERGDLPNFRKLREAGCEAVLESRYPPLTPAAWTSLSTGLKPAGHGVYDFWEYEEPQERGAARKSRVQTHRKGGKAIWNILSEFGKQVLVINVPVTYPPEPVNGIMVSGYMTPSTNVDFTFPAAFKDELFRAVPDYEIDVDLRSIFGGQPEKEKAPLMAAVLLMTRRRIDLTMYLLRERPWDFCYVAFVGADRLQHCLWDEIMAFDSRAIEYYQLLDHGLGLIMEQLGSDDTLFVVSDHGFQGAKRLFDINEYLISKGLLKLTNSEVHDKAVRRNDLKHRIAQLGLLSLSRNVAGGFRSVGLVKAKVDDVHRPILNDIDWLRSQACVPSVSGYGGGYADIFLTDDLNAERVAELCADLKSQVDPLTGQLLVEALYTTEVYGSGPYAPPEPHILILPNDGITFPMSFGNKNLWDSTSRTHGTHHKDGVLYAYGGGLKQGFKAPNAEIYDLVPTILRSMGLPAPCAFDGRVLDELFLESKKDEQLAGAASSGVASGNARRKLQELLEA